ncbi:MAG: hypothetical protein M3O01_05095 [Pseudomonadota bacterium]|nr:hypothetical protein [Pseudomonadota bacterium]
MAMKPGPDGPRSTTASIIFALLDPIPYGFLVAACLFDVGYASHPEVLWIKAAAWLIAVGLLFAIVPRLINLVQVWFTGSRPRVGAEIASFWLNVGAIAAATVNAFVHSRDAYAAMPEGLWLSGLTVALLVLGRLACARHQWRIRASS